MADSAVAITAGSGTNIDTRTESTNGQHRQVVVLGDPAANLGVAPVDATNGLAVQIIPALPAGTNAIGKLAANSGVIIGDVNLAASQTLATVTTVGTVSTVTAVTNVATIGTSVTPGTSAAHLGKAEDAAHSSGDTGVAVFGVRSDTTPSSTSGTAGDYSLPNLDANGRLYVNASQYDSAGTSATDTTAHAVKVLQVDSTGAVVGTSVAATTDTITAKLATDTIQNGTTALTPKFAKIAVSSSGVNSFIALVGGKKLRCLGFAIMGNGAVNVKFQSHVTPTDLTGLFYIAAAGGGVSLSFNPVGWFETVSGEAMDINLSGAVAIGGIMTYVEV